MLSEAETLTLWSEAQTFAEVCAVMRRFVAGELPLSPDHGGPIDPETVTIVPHLVALNDAGLLTTHSQPGLAVDDTEAQRACVEGFALEEAALRFAERALYTDLHVQVSPPGVDAGYMVPITKADGHPYTWTGRADADLLQGFISMCTASAVAELRSAWYVVAIDLQWGRPDHLWRELLAPRKTGYSVRPHPDLGIDHDFIC